MCPECFWELYAACKWKKFNYRSHTRILEPRHTLTSDVSWVPACEIHVRQVSLWAAGRTHTITRAYTFTLLSTSFGCWSNRKWPLYLQNMWISKEGIYWGKGLNVFNVWKMKSAFYSQEYPVILSVLQEIKKRSDLGWKHCGPGVWGLNVSVLLPSQLSIYCVRWKDPPDISTPSLAFF